MPLWSTWLANGAGATTPVFVDATNAYIAATTTASNTALYYNNGLANNSLANQTSATTTAGLYGLGLGQIWWSDEQVEQAQYVALAQQRVAVTRRRTEEERRRDEEMRARHQQEQLRLAQERAAALARSRELLLEHLTADQRASFEREKFFVVEGGRSRQLYRIRDRGSYSANIDVLEGRPGKVTHRLCCHLADYRVPLYDHLLAQKVWIESDEDGFLRQANRHAA
jgi:hypothetical protein